VRVEVNGVPVGELVGAGPASRFEEYRLAVPADVLARSPETTIRFSAMEASPPSDAVPRGARLSLRSLALRSRP